MKILKHSGCEIAGRAAALDVQNNDGYGPCADCHGFTLFKSGSRLLDRNAAVILAAKNGHTPVVESEDTEFTLLISLHTIGRCPTEGRAEAQPGQTVGSHASLNAVAWMTSRVIGGHTD